MLVLKGRILIDGTGAIPLDAPIVTIENGVVGSVQSQSESVSVPSEAEIIDVSDGTFLPGFINPHVHLTFSSSDNALRDALQDSNETLLLRAAQNAQLALVSGTTTLRDCGGRGYLTLALRDAVAEEIIQGPRILASGT